LYFAQAVRRYAKWETILKEEDGTIVESKLLVVKAEQADRWLTIGSGRKVVGA